MACFIKKTVSTIIILILILSVDLVAQQSRVNLYGFFDMEASVSNQEGNRSWTFDQHHFNLMSHYKLDHNFKVTSELEWEHGPSHEEGNFSGKIYLARAFLEYKYANYFGVRVGKFMTPFGIYNERHDATPTFLSTVLPHSVYGKHELATETEDRNFALTSTGIQFLGTQYYNKWQVRYQFIISNGRGEEPGSSDNNPNKAIGGRLVVTLPISQMSVGASFYSEKNGNEFNSRQKVFGIEFEADLGKLHIESEAIHGKVELLNDQQIPNNIFKETKGAYILTAYTFKERITPFIIYEYLLHDIHEDHPAEQLLMFGVNYALTEKIFLKSEYHFYGIGDSEPDDQYEIFRSSVAVAF